MRFGRSRRGFVIIELLAIIAVAGAVMFFAGPSIGKSINSVFAGTKNQQKATYKETEQYSMFYKDDKGNFKPAPIPYKRTKESLNYVNTEPPETLWQKFTKLGVMAVVIIVLLSYLGIWPIITLWWSKKVKPKITQLQDQLEAEQEAKNELNAEARRIVISVDEGLATLNTSIATANALVASSADAKVKETQLAVSQALTKAKEEFLAGMSRKQDQSTKDLVKELLKND